jgi:hypothetical protein
MPLCFQIDVDKGGRLKTFPQYGQKKYVWETGF